MTRRKLPALLGFVLVLAAGVALIVAGVRAAHPATVDFHHPQRIAVYYRSATPVRAA
jgi:hypothetical protein